MADVVPFTARPKLAPTTRRAARVENTSGSELRSTIEVLTKLSVYDPDVLPVLRAIIDRRLSRFLP